MKNGGNILIEKLGNTFPKESRRMVASRNCMDDASDVIFPKLSGDIRECNVRSRILFQYLLACTSIYFNMTAGLYFRKRNA
jgi:hypothetical protein